MKAVKPPAFFVGPDFENTTHPEFEHPSPPGFEDLKGWLLCYSLFNEGTGNIRHKKSKAYILSNDIL